jgi:beta-galactosidase
MKYYYLLILSALQLVSLHLWAGNYEIEINKAGRERILINDNWRFYKYGSNAEADNLIYDTRPDVTENTDSKDADSKPTEAVEIVNAQAALKPWILPSANAFINNPANRYIRPEGNPGHDFPFVQETFADSSWELVNLPHDWGIKGPFMEGPDAEVGGGMGRLPSHGVAWYRRKLEIPVSDKGRSIFLDIDGAMSYAMVWLNGNLVGGWPYGYNSWRLDLTQHIRAGGENQLAIRIDNPPHSARWYPGGGIYRDVWLVKAHPVHIAHWGTFVTSESVSEKSATIHLSVNVDNDSKKEVTVDIESLIYRMGPDGNYTGKEVGKFKPTSISIGGGKQGTIKQTAVLKNPELWGPLPAQKPNMYKVVTTILAGGRPIDQYETPLGIRIVEFHPKDGLLVNGEKIIIKGVNQHHDLGALGAAFNKKAARRQLEILRDMGCNAIRMAHNPPAPGLLELTDCMGFLVLNEIFDVWERKKTPLDFHLIFPDWYEADIRSFIRRDRNHPSVIAWSFGNEVGEQYTGDEGAALAEKLYNIVREEDPTRAATLSVNFAKPGSAIAAVGDIINLNYQGEGIRNAPAYAHLQGIRTDPLYSAFHEAYPGRTIISSETASALSSRGTYLFPVFEGISAPVGNGQGGDPVKQHVSAYELYTAPFGSSADKVFATQDRHPFVAGEFVWTGWDYLGEPTPYYGARSSYSGIIDLAGFKKDRFYLYQSRWRPELPVVHILPHWNWPERKGKVTPVHLFTSGDEAELFLNGKSLGRKKKKAFEYRIRWDDVLYEPGELKAVAYKNGLLWADKVVKTTGKPAQLKASADSYHIKPDGDDLVFITVQVADEEGLTVPVADNEVTFSISGPGELIATDNGDPACMTVFRSPVRNAFNGLVLAIIKAKKGESGTISVRAESNDLKPVTVDVYSKL